MTKTKESAERDAYIKRMADDICGTRLGTPAVPLAPETPEWGQCFAPHNLTFKPSPARTMPLPALRLSSRDAP